MTRKRLVEIPSEVRNEFARSHTFAQLVSRCFSPHILPPRPARFTSADVQGGLYIPVRTWVDGGERAGEPVSFEHERHLDELFWETAEDHRKIYIEGDVGCGKSTLIDYYLRCYCPSNGSRAADFDRKLILHFEAEGIQDSAEYSHNFFLSAQSVIRSQCEERGFNIDAAMQERRYSSSSVRHWVWAALEALSRRHGPFQYVVLVIDNIDTTPVEVQLRAIKDVDTWLRAPTINLWRVIIPLWPSTAIKLRNHGFDPPRNHSRFRIGPVPVDDLFQARLTAIQAELDRPTNAAVPPQARQYLRDTQTIVNERLLPRITSLAGGDLRRKLSMCESFVCGEVAHNLWRHLQPARDPRRGFEYELLDGLLRGPYDVLNPDHTRIANVFTLGPPGRTCRDLLIGLHSLRLLEFNYTTRGAFAAGLMRLGYDEEAIDTVEQSLRTFNAFHETPTAVPAGLGVQYEAHQRVVQAYLALCIEPAYVDNAAMVTPVDLPVLARMRKTRGDATDDFPERVESTLAFIEFVRDDEDRFARRSAVPPGTDVGLFERALADVKLPRYSKRMILRYRERLLALRGGSYLPAVPRSWWDEVLGRPLFAHAEAAGDFLTPTD